MRGSSAGVGANPTAATGDLPVAPASDRLAPPRFRAALPRLARGRFPGGQGVNDIAESRTAADLALQLTEFAEQCSQLRSEIGNVIVGQEEVVDGVIIGLLADGHVLLEGIPGLGKTLLVRHPGRRPSCRVLPASSSHRT